MSSAKNPLKGTLKHSLAPVFLNLSLGISKDFYKSLMNSPSALHDYRVAIRRTRCLLSQFKSVISKENGRYFRHEFLWLFTETGKMRDMDVLLADLQMYESRLPDSLKIDMLVLNEFLLAQKQVAQKALVVVLTSRRYLQLLDDWPIFLIDKDMLKPKFTNQSIEVFIKKRVHVLKKHILQQGLLAEQSAADEIFHELRKLCKKLRYLLEIFAHDHTQDEAHKLLHNLKLLQDNLGRHQDLCVQIQFFLNTTILKQDTIDHLVALLQDEKQQLRSEFNDVFQQFTKLAKS